MIPTDELVKKFDNIYPAKFGKIKMMKSDGSFEETIVFDIVYDKAEQILECYHKSRVAKRTKI